MMTQNYSRQEVMTASVKHHIAHKQHAHEVWLDRQERQKRIKEQDCYGYKSAKVQDVGRACARGSQAR